MKARVNTKRSRATNLVVGLLAGTAVAVLFGAWVASVANDASIGDVGYTPGPPTSVAAPPADRSGTSVATTSTAPAPTVPTTKNPTTTQSLPPKVPGMTDCGIITDETSPTIPAKNASSYDCLRKGWVSGSPTRLVERSQPDGRGGAGLVTTYDVLGPGRLHVTEDASHALGGPQGITAKDCTALVIDKAVIIVTGCTGGAAT